MEFVWCCDEQTTKQHPHLDKGSLRVAVRTKGHNGLRCHQNKKRSLSDSKYRRCEYTPETAKHFLYIYITMSLIPAYLLHVPKRLADGKQLLIQV